MKKASKLGIAPKIYDDYFCKDEEGFKHFIVQKYMNGGTLNEWLSNGNKLTTKMKNQLLSKKRLMHKHDIIHNDLHNNNILVNITKKGTIEFYIADFGQSLNLASTINQLVKQDSRIFQDLIIDNKSPHVVLNAQNAQEHDKRVEALVILDMIINSKISNKT